MAFPATYNISYYHGDTYQFVIVPRNADGSAFSLAGYTAVFSIATQRDPVTSPIQGTALITGNTVVCTIPTGVGEALLTSQLYVYDVQVRNPSLGVVYTLLTGNINITGDVSRNT